MKTLIYILIIAFIFACSPQMSQDLNNTNDVIIEGITSTSSADTKIKNSNTITISKIENDIKYYESVIKSINEEIEEVEKNIEKTNDGLKVKELSKKKEILKDQKSAIEQLQRSLQEAKSRLDNL